MGALSGIGNSFQQLKDAAVAAAPKPKGPLNAGLDSAADTLAKTGSMSQQDIANRSLQGVGSQPTPSAQTMAQESGHLGGNQDLGMQSALANRTNKLFSSHVNQLQNIAKMNAPMIQAQQQNQAMAGLAGNEQMKNQMTNTEMVKQQNDESQRNSVLSGILNLGGKVASMIPGVGSAVGALMPAAGEALMGPQHGIQSLDTSGNNQKYFGGG